MIRISDFDSSKLEVDSRASLRLKKIIFTVDYLICFDATAQLLHPTIVCKSICFQPTPRSKIHLYKLTWWACGRISSQWFIFLFGLVLGMCCLHASRFHFHDLIVFKVKIAPLFEWICAKLLAKTIRLASGEQLRQIRSLQNIFLSFDWRSN